MDTRKIKLLAKVQNQEDYHGQNVEGRIILFKGDWKVEVPVMELPSETVMYTILNPTDFIPKQDLLVIGDIYQHSEFKVKVVLLYGVTTEDHEYAFGKTF